MANRHKAQAKGKNVGGAAVAYGNPRVLKEAKETKRGGKVHGAAAKHRVDKRARGGRVGSDKSPFSSAHVKSHAPAHNPGPISGGK